MQKIIINTEDLTLEAFNFTATDNEVIVGVCISEEHTLMNWLKVSKAFSYNIEVANKRVVSIHIPLNDITSIQYEQD